MNTKDDFFPAGYEVPNKSNGYMKFEQGENKFRILSKPIIGYEWWIDKEGEIREKNSQPQAGDKPVRVRMNQPVPVGAADVVRHFWAVVVWNYKAEKFQILEVTQKSIQNTIKNISADEDWGSPLLYDLVVTKTGEKLDTEYQVKPKPAKPVDEGILSAYNKLTIKLEALFDGGDPFGEDTGNSSADSETTEPDF